MRRLRHSRTAAGLTQRGNRARYRYQIQRDWTPERKRDWLRLRWRVNASKRRRYLRMMRDCQRRLRAARHDAGLTSAGTKRIYAKHTTKNA